MTDWTPQADWSTVKVGDQVRARTDDGDQCTGKVSYIFSPAAWGEVDRVVIDSPSLSDLTQVRKDEWSLFVPAKPAVEIPNTPGIYVSWNNPPSPTIVHKITDGRWVDADDTHYLTDKHVVALLPLARLEEVAVTAKKVCAFIGFAPWPIGMTLQEVLDVALEEFGVTNV